MKKLLILVWCTPLCASHIGLAKIKKVEFTQKRLAMMKSQLGLKLRELLISNSNTAKSAQLKEEIAQLEISIPIAKNSIQALERT